MRQQDVKVSRLASLRLGSGVALRSRTLTASLGGALPEVAPSGRFIEQQWDNSFQLPDRVRESLLLFWLCAKFAMRWLTSMCESVVIQARS